MTLPLEVIFCNMPPDQSLEAAAQDEVSLLESGRHLTSCRIRITLSKAVFSKSEYDVQIAVLAGPKLFCAEGDSPWAWMLRHAAHWPKGVSPDTAETPLHRAFTKIHAQLQ